MEDQGCEDCACWEGEAWWDRDQVWSSERGEEEGEGEDSDEGGIEEGDGCEGVADAMIKESLFYNGWERFATGSTTELSDRSYPLHFSMRQITASTRKMCQIILYTEAAKQSHATRSSGAALQEIYNSPTKRPRPAKTYASLLFFNIPH